MSTKKRFLLAGLLVVIAAAALVLAGTALANGKLSGSGQGDAADPQLLMIPRWFLSSLTLDGREVQLPAEKHLTLQFAEGNQANGEGGCNSFGGSYKAGKDGSLTFGNLISTMMACEGVMDQESAYFNALSQVKHYHFEQGKLILSSADGQTVLVFVKPQK